MNARLLLSAMLRESRGARGRMLFFTGCLALGVAAVVGTGALVRAIESGMTGNARHLLAADMVVESRQPLADEILALLPDGDDPDEGRTARMVELVTMAAAPSASGSGRSRLVELKAVEASYPFYGDLVLAPPGRLSARIDDHSVAVAEPLLAALGLSVGDDLLLGGERFGIAALVLEEPDRLDFSLAMGPRVFVTLGGLERSGLLRFGSRVDHKLLVSLPGSTRAELDALGEAVDEAAAGGERVRVRTWRESQAGVERGIRRVEHALGLAALLSLIMGGTGVAQIVSSWLASRTQSVAVMRCLGFRPREILVLYLGHVLLLAGAGCLAGAALGSALPWIVSQFAAGILPVGALPVFDGASVLRGVSLGLGIAVLFALPPLSAIWRIPPARVLRAEAAPLPAHRGVNAVTGVLLVGGLYLAAFLQSGDDFVALLFTGGLLAMSATLAAASWLVMRGVGRLPRDGLSPYVLHGLGAMARPGAGTTGAIVALGVGVLVVTQMAIVERRLGDDLASLIPADAPTAFLVDVQPDQWDSVRSVLEEHHAQRIDSVPVVMARLAAVKGRDVQEILAERREDGQSRRGEWRLTREQRLTWLDVLPEENTLVAGEWWSDPERAELSVEAEFAADLGVGVGDTLSFNVQGMPMEFLVTSLREVRWQTFGINFFLVTEPGVLEDAPHFRIAATRLPPGAEAAAQDAIVARHPNVAYLGISDILARVMALMRRLEFGVHLLGTFTIVTGLLVLAGAIGSSHLRRGREAALLKTLGVTRAGVTGLFATEYALQGAVAGLVGSVFACVLSWIFLDQVLELDARLSPLIVPTAVLGSVLMATICGVLASLGALRAPPVETLRG